MKCTKVVNVKKTKNRWSKLLQMVVNSTDIATELVFDDPVIAKNVATCFMNNISYSGIITPIHITRSGNVIYIIKTDFASRVKVVEIQ